VDASSPYRPRKGAQGRGLHDWCRPEGGEKARASWPRLILPASVDLLEPLLARERRTRPLFTTLFLDSLDSDYPATLVSSWTSPTAACVQPDSAACGAASSNFLDTATHWRMCCSQ